jgi:RNA-directed DNA polymerase
LRRELLAGTYVPGSYTHFFIHETKRRKISAARFCDRVVHHTLCQIIEPRFENVFIPDSYANRTGKGTHRAIDRFQQFARGYRYVFRADIRQHFASIDRSILMQGLAVKIPEQDDISFAEFDASVQGWINYARFADSWGLRKAYG